MKYFIALIIALIVILFSCRISQGESKPHIDQMPVVVRHNINDLKDRTDNLKESQVETMEKSARIRQIADQFNIDVEAAKTVIKVSDAYDVSPEILLKVITSP